MLRLVATAATGLGLELPRLYARVGIDSTALNRAGSRIPIGSARLAWQRASEVAGQPAFGLLLASSMQPGSLGALDSLVASASTLGGAFNQLARYGPLLANSGEISLVKSGNVARFVQRARGGIPWISHLLLALAVRRMREFVGSGFAPFTVSFAGPVAGGVAAFEQFFGTSVRFGQPVNEIVFDRGLLEERLRPTATRADLEHEAERALLGISFEHTSFPEIYGAVAEGVMAGNANLDCIADRMGTSVRTLQRRFSEVGTSHRAVVEHLRAELAERQLRDQHRTQCQVARELGYATPSSFHRALKRWGKKRRTV
jgi:AraC-like DNA-binding protein